ncbi:ferredoxin [Actinoallomurus acanthiterrae]
MTWLIEVDGHTCIGSGICAGAAPGHFTLVDGTSRPIRRETDPAEQAVDAAESCPVEAISIRDKETGEIVAPEQ